MSFETLVDALISGLLITLGIFATIFAFQKYSRAILIGSGVLMALLVLLPPSALYPNPIPIPSEISIAFTWLFETIWAFDFMIPMATLLMMFFFIIMVDVVFLLFRIGLFIWGIFNKA